MATRLGLNAKLYIDQTATVFPAAPNVGDLVELTNARDVTLNLSLALADVSTRGGGGFRQQVGTLAEGTVTSQVLFDDADASFAFLTTKFFARESFPVLVFSGDIAAPNNEGLWMPAQLTNFT